MFTIPVYDKNLKLGEKAQYKSNSLYLEYEDASNINEGEKITLMKWGNVMINKVTKTENSVSLEGEFLKDDNDFKSTKKLCWLDSKSPLTEVTLVEFDNILKTKKYDSDDPKIKLEDVVNKETKFTTTALTEPHVKTLNTGISI